MLKLEVYSTTEEAAILIVSQVLLEPRLYVGTKRVLEQVSICRLLLRMHFCALTRRVAVEHTMYS